MSKGKGGDPEGGKEGKFHKIGPHPQEGHTLAHAHNPSTLCHPENGARTMSHCGTGWVA